MWCKFRHSTLQNLSQRTTHKSPHGGHSTPNLNTKSKIRDPKHRTQNTKHKTQNTKHRPLNPKSKLQDPRPKTETSNTLTLKRVRSSCSGKGGSKIPKEASPRGGTLLAGRAIRVGGGAIHPRAGGGMGAWGTRAALAMEGASQP